MTVGRGLDPTIQGNRPNLRYVLSFFVLQIGDVKHLVVRSQATQQDIAELLLDQIGKARTWNWTPSCPSSAAPGTVGEIDNALDLPPTRLSTPPRSLNRIPEPVDSDSSDSPLALNAVKLKEKAKNRRDSDVRSSSKKAPANPPPASSAPRPPKSTTKDSSLRLKPKTIATSIPRSNVAKTPKADSGASKTSKSNGSVARTPKGDLSKTKTSKAVAGGPRPAISNTSTDDRPTPKVTIKRPKPDLAAALANHRHVSGTAAPPASTAAKIGSFVQSAPELASASPVLALQQAMTKAHASFINPSGQPDPPLAPETTLPSTPAPILPAVNGRDSLSSRISQSPASRTTSRPPADPLSSLSRAGRECPAAASFPVSRAGSPLFTDYARSPSPQLGLSHQSSTPPPVRPHSPAISEANSVSAYSSGSRLSSERSTRLVSYSYSLSSTSMQVPSVGTRMTMIQKKRRPSEHYAAILRAAKRRRHSPDVIAVELVEHEAPSPKPSTLAIPADDSMDLVFEFGDASGAVDLSLEGADISPPPGNSADNPIDVQPESSTQPSPSTMQQPAPLSLRTSRLSSTSSHHSPLSAPPSYRDSEALTSAKHDTVNDLPRLPPKPSASTQHFSSIAAFQPAPLAQPKTLPTRRDLSRNRSTVNATSSQEPLDDRSISLSRSFDRDPDTVDPRLALTNAETLISALKKENETLKNANRTLTTTNVELEVALAHARDERDEGREERERMRDEMHKLEAELEAKQKAYVELQRDVHYRRAELVTKNVDIQRLHQQIALQKQQIHDTERMCDQAYDALEQIKTLPIVAPAPAPAPARLRMYAYLHTREDSCLLLYQQR